MNPSVEIPQAVADEARARFDAVQARIAKAAARAGRAPGEITLVGVAKRQSQRRILAAIAAGVRVLGQSYIQEMREVRPQIEAALASTLEAAVPRLEWRMVGRLQRNKAGLAARLFDAIETIDRLELAQAVSRRAVQENRELDVLIQVSLCGEAQKGGCEPDAMSRLAESILDLPNLQLRGLMTIPAADPNPETARPVYAALRELGEVLGGVDSKLAQAALSMGMSGDFEVAIEEGATLVRVGTALFGDRIDPKATA
jgi:pyridoxal phosphate enzyme (YggS family)